MLTLCWHIYPSDTSCCQPPVDYFKMAPGEKAALVLEMGLLITGNEQRATQTMTEAAVATVQDSLPAIQRAAIAWWCARNGVAYDGEAVPPEDYTDLSKHYREMLKKVLGGMLLKLEVVYLCPVEHCDGYRRTKQHDTPCEKCGASYFYLDKHGLQGVCTLRYYPMATLIRYLFADPLKTRHLSETFRNCEPEPDAMSGVHGESRHRATRRYLVFDCLVFDCLLPEPTTRPASILGYRTP
jgi:hypothetical protein